MVDRDGKRLVVRLVSDFGQSLLLLEEQRTRVDSRCLESLGLTRREAEVLSWVAEGKTNGEIRTILAECVRICRLDGGSAPTLKC